METFELTHHEMSMLRFLSQSAAQERKFGEDGWLRRPDEMERKDSEAVDNLIKHEMLEERGNWLRPTEAGESVLAQVEAAHSAKNS